MCAVRLASAEAILWAGVHRMLSYLHFRDFSNELRWPVCEIVLSSALHLTCKLRAWDPTPSTPASTFSLLTHHLLDAMACEKSQLRLSSLTIIDTIKEFRVLSDDSVDATEAVFEVVDALAEATQAAQVLCLLPVFEHSTC